MLGKTLQNLLTKNKENIKELEWDETEEKYWLIIKGYHFRPGNPCNSADCLHTISRATVKEILEEWKDKEPCSCSECTNF